MDDADVSDEYRNILERIFGDDQPTDTDQRERLTPAEIARVMRQSAADARRAAELAPADLTDTWTTVAEGHGEMADHLESGSSVPPALTDEFLEATRTVVRHAREDLGIAVGDERSRPDPGPPPPIPDDPPFDIPDTPVDQDEYRRRIEDSDLTMAPDLTAVEVVERVDRMAVTLRSIAEVAPLDIRPAFTVAALYFGDALAAIRTPDDGVFTTVSTAQLQAAFRHISTALDR